MDSQPIRNWTVSSTAELLQGSSYEYREGPPVDAIDFAGTGERYSISRALIEPYGANSVGLVAYGGWRDFGENHPYYSYHLRSSREGRLVLSARRPQTPSVDQAPHTLEGTWLYGGDLMHHFGHFMSESSHRAYPVFHGRHDQAGFAGIVFASRWPLRDFQRALLRDFHGVSCEVHVVHERPTLIEELVMVPQGSILGLSPVTERYRDMLDESLEAATARTRGRNKRDLFIGRSHLTTGGGGLENERQIEEYFTERGFTSFRPENYPLEEQLLAVASADRIVGVGGSFVHLMDHLPRSSASMLLISRADPDSYYHRASLLQKANGLQILEPSVDDGDVVKNQVSDSGRTVVRTRYNFDRLRALFEGYLATTG